MERIPITLLPLRLREITGVTAPGYRHIWTMIVNGDLPMAELYRGRWYVREADLPALARALRMTAAEPGDPPPARVTSYRRRGAATPSGPVAA